MMGSSAPSQSTLSDLKVLLELLQAAQDPKKAKAAIDSISEARKQYDDAIVEANTRITVALAAEKSAEAAAAKAEAAADKLEKKSAEVDAKVAAMKDERESLEGDKQIFATYKAEVAAEAKANVDARAAMVAANEVAQKRLAADRAALDVELMSLDRSRTMVDELRIEFQDKLAKFKALTA